MQNPGLTRLIQKLRNYSSKFSLTPGEKEAWCQALESGEYEQGRESLAAGKRHCCLGVYASICGVLDESPTLGCARVVSDDGLLPASFFPERAQRILSRANDGGLSFADIAYAIRQAL